MRVEGPLVIMIYASYRIDYHSTYRPWSVADLCMRQRGCWKSPGK